MLTLWLGFIVGLAGFGLAFPPHPLHCSHLLQICFCWRFLSLTTALLPYALNILFSCSWERAACTVKVKQSHAKLLCQVFPICIAHCLQQETSGEEAQALEEEGIRDTSVVAINRQFDMHFVIHLVSLIMVFQETSLAKQRPLCLSVFLRLGGGESVSPRWGGVGKEVWEMMMEKRSLLDTYTRGGKIRPQTA